MSLLRGSCHCGAVRFEAECELRGLEVCNCSLCRRNGYIHCTVEPDAFHLLTDWDAIETYEFGTRTAKNHFCRTCGISPFRRSRADPDKIDLNVRCLEGVDLEALSVSHFDGANWEAYMASGRRGA